MTDKRQLKSKFTMEERIKIAQEFVSSNLSARELNEKYGIRGKNVIPTWRDRYLLGKYYLHKSKKSSTFAGEIKTGIVMNDPERQQLVSQIAELERLLQKEQMKNLALNTLIDVAEEQGIQIRKKSGAKQ
ncbi:MAG: hypothetical protein MJZ84_02600 [Paludibacteraceae bacterium]|nr:hypothetical protein [Paludibacteraceae bacterium]